MKKPNNVWPYALATVGLTVAGFNAARIRAEQLQSADFYQSRYLPIQGIFLFLQCFLVLVTRADIRNFYLVSDQWQDHRVFFGLSAISPLAIIVNTLTMLYSRHEHDNNHQLTQVFYFGFGTKLMGDAAYYSATKYVFNHAYLSNITTVLSHPEAFPDEAVDEVDRQFWNEHSRPETVRAVV